MRKAKKSPEIKYGIEVTKPHSKEMYDHNEMVAEEMKDAILTRWIFLITKLEDDDRYLMDRDWNEDDLKAECPDIVKLQKGVCFSGYGDGYTIQMVNDEFKKELDTMANWQLHEEYSYMCFKGLVRRTRFMMLGFEWSKHDYSFCTDIDLSPASPEVAVEQTKNIHVQIAEEVAEIRKENKY